MEGQVYKSTGSWYQVKAEDGRFWRCRIKGKFRLQGIKSTNPIAVGDWVSFNEDEKGEDSEGVIHEIAERRNYLLRKSTNLSKQTHIIAANVDCLFLVITLKNPPTSFGFVDRFLVMAEAYKVPVHLVINKVDLHEENDTEIEEWKELYQGIGYPVTFCSATTGEGIDHIAQTMAGIVSAFSGHSGVGKSSILKCLAPERDIKIGDTSTVHLKGKHTTTFAEMFDMDNDRRVIDTPGIKGFGLTQLDKDEIALYFVEMKSALDDCKFYNCKHLNEPKCAVKAAVENGDIAESRYQSYINMMEDDEGNYRTDKYG